MMKKRLLSACLALMLAVSLPVTALAANDDDDDDDYEEVRSVSITPSEVTILVDQSRTLKAKVSPRDADDDSISWETSDYSVVEVDDDGVITGVDTGTARITAYAHNGKKDTITVTVTNSARKLVDSERNEDENDSFSSSSSSGSGSIAGLLFGDSGSSSSSKSGSSSIAGILKGDSGSSSSSKSSSSSIAGLLGNSESNSSTGNSNTTAEVTDQELSPKVSAALGNASPGTTPSVVLSGKTSVAGSALRSAANSAKTAGKSLTLKFTTAGSSGSTQGQLNINAANAANAQSINTAIYTDEASVSAVRDKFAKQYGKTVAVIKCGQQGSYNMSVDVYGKVNLGQMDTSKLVFDVYDAATNTHSRLSKPSYNMDTANGYLRLTTTTGGYIIISQG